MKCVVLLLALTLPVACTLDDSGGPSEPGPQLPASEQHGGQARPVSAPDAGGEMQPVQPELMSGDNPPQVQDPVAGPAGGETSGASVTDPAGGEGAAEPAALDRVDGGAAPEPAAPGDEAPDRLPEGGTLRVAPDGSGRFTTLTEALLEARSGSELLVAPGVYKQPMVFDRKLSLVAEAGGVVVDGGIRPAVSLDAMAQVTLRGIRLVSSSAAASVGRGQLVLEQCQLSARPTGVALRTTDARSQVVLRRCLLDAGQGTAMQLHPASHGDLRDCSFTWSRDNADPVLTKGSPPAFTVERCRFGWRRQDERALLPAVLAAPMPADGRLPLRVVPERAAWPAWARAGTTHFASIHAALAAAEPGLRIDVEPGRYEESVGLRKSVHLRAAGPPGSVSVHWAEGPCLWFNGTTRASVSGFTLICEVPDRTAAVQVNGGQLDLTDCRIENPEGHALIVTSSYAEGSVVLERCELSAGLRALYVTGSTSRAELNDSTLRAGSHAIFTDSGTVSATSTRLFADQVALEVWGDAARVQLTHCSVGATPQVLKFSRGASRSQVETSDLLLEPVPGGPDR